MAAAGREPLSTRLLAPIVNVREGESLGAFMMFAYSFLAMTAYNIVQPIVRSRFITALGSDNLPYVLLVSVFIIGALMQGYSRLGSLLPGRWLIPATQLGMVALLGVFWVLAGLGNQWVEVAFYLFGQVYGILLISQFWTLANLIYNARAAKRLFGFIGAGASLGGITGGGITTLAVERVGNRNLMLVSAVVLALCALLVIAIVRRVKSAEFAGVKEAGKEQGVGWFEALQMLRQSRHLQIIAVVIALTSIGAGLIDQQLNMATEFFKGRGATDSMTTVLASVQVYTSAIGFVIQLWLTSRIHRYLGVGFALLILPISLGITGITILLNAALWTPMFARVVDKSIRYTVDKTTREVLFLPLSADIKQKAKPFVDVTLDRVGRAASAFLLLVLIKPWGLGLNGPRWNQISWASLVVMIIWIALAIRAKRGYVETFRRSLTSHDVNAADIRLPTADLSTIEILIDELGHPDEQRVLYAVDLLDALDRRHLITPLLLHHESARVRIRVLHAIQHMDAEHAARFDRLVERVLKDEDLAVRAAAVAALAHVRGVPAFELMRSYLADADARVRLSAAAALADSSDARDLALAEDTLEAIARDASAEARHDLAAALEHVKNPRFRRILISLFFDQDEHVARRAIVTARASSDADPLFVPALVSLLRRRSLRSDARDALLAFGPAAEDTLGYVLADTDEDLAVRREIPQVLSGIAGASAVDRLVAVLADGDGALRFAALAALERLNRIHNVAVPAAPLEAAILKESNRYFTYLGLRHNLFDVARGDATTLLSRALDEKLARTMDRIYRLLALLHPWRDIETARWAIGRGDPRARASATEYLDNLLTGVVRKRVVPIVDEMPIAEKVRKGNVFLRTRVRSVDETLAQLIHDDDQVIAAAAIQYVDYAQHWSLTDDIEYVLQHRDPRDWYVFEAASWALAGRRLENVRRRALWLEPYPAIELANRLGRLPLFAFVPVNELVQIGAAGRQARYESGRAIAADDAAKRTLLFILDGSITLEDSAGIRRVESPAAIALDEVLRGTAFVASVRASDITATLELPYDAFLGLLADNPSLVHGLFRVVLPEEDLDAMPVLRGRGSLLPHRSATAADTFITLEQLELFTGAATGDLLALAARARTLVTDTGTPLLTEAEPAAFILVLAGQVTIERPDGSGAHPVAAGEAIGAHAALCGTSARRRAYAASPGSVLRIESADLLQVLGERVGLLQRVFEAVAVRPADAQVATGAPAGR